MAQGILVKYLENWSRIWKEDVLPVVISSSKENSEWVSSLSIASPKSLKDDASFVANEGEFAVINVSIVDPLEMDRFSNTSAGVILGVLGLAIEDLSNDEFKSSSEFNTRLWRRKRLIFCTGSSKFCVVLDLTFWFLIPRPWKFWAWITVFSVVPWLVEVRL